MIRRFRGKSVHKVDQKGRVSVPAPFRRVLEDGDPDWAPGQNPDLGPDLRHAGRPLPRGLHHRGRHPARREGLAAAGFSPQRRALERLLNTQSIYAQVDENGRIVLPQRLRETLRPRGRGALRRHGRAFPDLGARRLARTWRSIDAWRAGLDEDEDPFAPLDAMDREGRS